jgi:hypothetical protein
MKKISSERIARKAKQDLNRVRKKFIRKLVRSGKLKRYARGFRNALVVSAPKRMRWMKTMKKPYHSSTKSRN